MKIAYLGPKGTYTEAALQKQTPGAEGIPLDSITDVFEAVASRQHEWGFVPIHNKIDKRVPETVKCLFQYKDALQIVGATLYPIQHAFGALPGHGKIKRILTKDTVFNQCSMYLKEHHSLAKRVYRNSTALAIQEIAKGQMKDAAAIGPEHTLEEYGLDDITKDIGNVKDNKTRFIFLGQTDSKPTGDDVTSLIIHPSRDRQKLLLNMLNIISDEYDLNMSFIDSDNDEKGRLVFYIDIQGHKRDKNVADCIQEIRQRLPDTEVYNLGSYPNLPFEPPLIKTIGHIGGTGDMGKFFNSFFESKGLEVLIAGRQTELTYEQCVENSDVVLVHAPPNHVIEVIEKIAPLMKPGQLLVDNTGIKSQVIPKMLELTADDVEVYSIHTMFGPDIKNLFGKNIIAIPTEKSGEMSQEFEDFFHKYGANITRATAKEHDFAVNPHQNIPHAMAVAWIYAMGEQTGHPNKSSSYETPVSRLFSIAAAKVHNGNPELYKLMKELNPSYQSSLNLVIEALQAMRSPDEFKRLMEKNRKDLGSKFISSGVKKSKAIEDLLSEEA